MLAAGREQDDVVFVRKHFMAVGNVGDAALPVDIHFKETVAVQLFREHARIVIGFSVGKQQMLSDIIVFPAGLVHIFFESGQQHGTGQVILFDMGLEIMFHRFASLVHKSISFRLHKRKLSGS